MALAASISAPCCETMGRKRKGGLGGGVVCGGGGGVSRGKLRVIGWGSSFFVLI